MGAFTGVIERIASGKLVYIGAVVAIAGVVLVVLNGTLSFHLSPLAHLIDNRAMMTSTVMFEA